MRFAEIDDNNFVNLENVCFVDFKGDEKYGYRWIFCTTDGEGWVSKDFSSVEEARTWLSETFVKGGEDE